MHYSIISQYPECVGLKGGIEQLNLGMVIWKVSDPVSLLIFARKWYSVCEALREYIGGRRQRGRDRGL